MPVRRRHPPARLPTLVKVGRAKLSILAEDTAIAPLTTIEISIPDEVLAALHRAPEEFAEELRLAAAIFWYSRGTLSQERAAQLADMDRTDFILALAREGVDAFAVDISSLRKELSENSPSRDDLSL